MKKTFLNIIATISLVALSACGFTPIYATHGDNAVLKQQLEVTEVSYPSTRINQLVGQSLVHLIRPEGVYKTKIYQLTINATATHSALSIQLDQEVTRYKSTVRATYTLKDKRTGAIIGNGNLQRQGGYDVVESEYAEYVSRDDLEQRIAKELAEDLKLDLISTFLEPQETELLAE